jgi:hypothetical protein
MIEHVATIKNCQEQQDMHLKQLGTHLQDHLEHWQISVLEFLQQLQLQYFTLSFASLRYLFRNSSPVSAFLK